MKLSFVEDEQMELQDLVQFVHEDYSLQLGIVGCVFSLVVLVVIVYCIPKDKII